MVRLAWDIDNNTDTLAWTSSTTAYTGYAYQGSFGSYDPRLEVEWSNGGDTTPPESISNLANTTTCNSINWTWENGTYSTDFNHTYIMKDNVFLHNVSNTTNYDLWSSLSENTVYTFSSKTVDTTGNMNATFVNQSATTNTSVTASFTKNVTGGQVSLPVQFNDTSTGDSISSWNWSWGDTTWTNTTDSASRNATHTFTSPGNFTVFLIATNLCGSDTSDNQYVVVTNATPTADFTSEPPTEGNAPLTVQFYNASTGEGITSWNWTFGDGGTSAAESPSHQYTVAGTYDVNLTVWNDGGWDDEKKIGYVIVHNATPVADFTANVTGGCIPTTVQFTDNSTGDNITQWSWKLNGVEFSTDQNPTYEFVNPGLYEWLNLTVTNDGGSNTTSWQDSFYFVDCAPDPITGLTNDTTTCEQITFNWTNPTNTNFNHTYVMQNNVWDQNVSNTSHSVTWLAPGGVTYNFSAQTVSILGNQSTTWVNGSATTVACGVAPVSEFSANDTTVCAGTAVQFTNASTNTPTDWAWTFDGVNTSIEENPIFIYNVTGLFSVNLTASNAYGSDDELKADYINVTDCTPPASITNLAYTNTTCQWTNWTWDNPADGDYSYLYILKNGVWHSNVSAPANTLNWSGITAGEFASRTVDTSGNMNATWVNMTAPDAAACDTTPPLAPGNLTNATTTCSYINWTWDDAGDDDYDTALVYRYDEGDPLGEYFYHFVGEPVFYDNWTGLTEDTEYTISLRSMDGHANVNTTWVNLTATTPFCVIPDTTPPASITIPKGLQVGCDEINWDWDNPSDADFDHIMIYRNNVFLYNLTTPTSSDNWVGLAESTSYTISTHTVDTTGNVNTTWINETESTDACPNPPIAGFTANDTAICAGDTVLFTDQPSGGAPTSWFWEFGTGDDDNVEDPTYQYLNPGTFSVNLRETNADGSDWENKTNYITVSDCSPVADFTANDTIVCNGTAVQFTDTTTNTPTSWAWTFDGVNTSVDQNPIFVYDVVGTFSVNLTATNAYNDDDELKVDYVSVIDCTPDTTAPGNVTNLTGSSPSCGTAEWTWDNPLDPDLSVVQLWLDGVFEENGTIWTVTHTEIGLGDGNYTLSILTMDTSGNWNTTWTNFTVEGVTVCAAPTTGGGVSGTTVTDNSGSLWAFSTLLLASVGLLLYGLIDNKNRVYGNIIAVFVSSILAAYLAVVAFAPIFSYNTILTSVVQFGTTSPVYTYSENYLEDASLGYMILIISVVGMIYAALMIYEAYGEFMKSKEDSE